MIATYPDRSFQVWDYRVSPKTSATSSPPLVVGWMRTMATYSTPRSSSRDEATRRQA